ncbi:MAG: NAD-dependent epimerase/dehydratase family protein [Pseudomonadota bacterium]
MPPDLPLLPPAAVAATGATGRIARLLWPVWGDAVRWRSRGDGPLAGTLAGCRALIALGGVTSGDAAALAGNTDAARDAVAAARADGVPRVLVLSSSAVYGRRAGPLTEDVAPTPANAYGEAKARMEAEIARLPAAGPEVCILRLGNVAGADALLGKLSEAPPRLDTFPDGATPMRNYLGPESLARILAALALHPAPLPPILNLGAPGRVAMGDLLRAAGRDWVAVPAPETALRDVALDTTRLSGLLPLMPDMSDAARMVAEWRRVTAP